MKKSFVVLLGLATSAGFADIASADSKCSKVDIRVINEFRDPATNAKVDIKVLDFQYWDKEDNKWRNESTSNQRINTGQSWVWNKNLEYVGGETGVKIKVTYKYSQAGGGGANWSVKHTEVSSPFKCVDGTDVDVTVS